MDREKRVCYKLGTFVFELQHTGEIPFPHFFERFRAGESERPSHIFELMLTDCLPQPKGVPVAHRADLDVYKITGFDAQDTDSDVHGTDSSTVKSGIDSSAVKGGAGREARLLRFVGAPVAYGYYEEIREGHSRSYFQRDFLSYSQIDTVFYSLFALERHLLGNNGLILHCAMLRVGEEALLFSGPSGVGKSTHADLWRAQIPDTEIINGDRALLQWTGDRLFAHGWCVSGSSGICVNRTLPVRAIVFLRQEPKNGGVSLRGLGAVKRLVSQITVNNWNPWAVERVWELAERLAQETAVYDYGCNMEPEAVMVLQQLLGMREE